jgi:hypothetical protein
MNWKWSIGEIYYKSARIKVENDIKQSENNIQNNNQSLVYDSATNALQQSLDQESFLDNNNECNIRENIDTKMATRELISQRGVNPFLQTSYVNDIVTRDMFLKPVNTTQDRYKQDESNNTAITY